MGTATAYRRELDISRAVHTVTYEDGGVHYRREAFASYPARVILFRFTADKPGALTGVGVDDRCPQGDDPRRRRPPGVRRIAGRIPVRSSAKPYAIALNYEAQLALLHDGGEVEAVGRPPGFQEGRRRDAAPRRRNGFRSGSQPRAGKANCRTPR